MGLYKRNQVWWMSINHNGQRVRRSTETANKRLAQKIYKKVLTQVSEGKWFEGEEARERTFKELVDKYNALLREHKAAVYE